MPNPYGYLLAGVAVLLIIAASMAWLIRPRTPDWGLAIMREDNWSNTDDEGEPLEPAEPFVAGAPVPPPVRVHSDCLDAWADGRRPCGRCETVLGVRQ